MHTEHVEQIQIQMTSSERHVILEWECNTVTTYIKAIIQVKYISS